MRKDPCVNISSLNDTQTRDHIRNKGGCIIYDRSTPIGIVLDNRNARALLGDRAWDINEYGHAISKIDAKLIKEKPWFIPQIHGTSSTNMVVFNEAFVRKNWQHIQLALDSKNTSQIANRFDLPTFPHVKLEAEEYNALQYTNNLDTPHFKVCRMRDDHIQFSELSDEINKLDTAITLTKKSPSTQNFHLLPIATALPISMLPEFEKSGVHITTRTPRDFFSQAKNIIDTHEAVILGKHHGTKNDPERIIVVNNAPTENIQNILDATNQQSPLPLTQKSRHITNGPTETKLTKLEIGAVIAGHIMESRGRSRTMEGDTTSNIVHRSGTVGSWVHSETHGRQHIAVTGNPKTIELLQKIPLSVPIDIRRAGKDSFLQDAFIHSSWLSDTTSHDQILQIQSKSRVQYQNKIGNTLKQLFEGAKGFAIVFDHEGQPACAITGSQEIACAMKTIERNLSKDFS